MTERHLMYALAIAMVKKAGKGQPMADFHLNDLSQAEQAEHRFLQAIVIEKQKPSAAPLVFGIVRAEGEERFF